MARYVRYSTHTVHELSVHIVWSTKYRYEVLQGEIAMRARDLIRQVCDASDVKIIKGVVAKDHIHIHVSRPPSLSESELVRKIKGRSARKLLEEYPELKRRYWGGHMWGIGFGAWSSGNVTRETINEYLKHHGSEPNSNEQFILEE